MDEKYSTLGVQTLEQIEETAQALCEAAYAIFDLLTDLRNDYDED